ncbi:MAG: hypothetical protein NTZ46_06150 [Verrucomicrobia bacterium]|nr:hypothetical protein [Verrucomicrobiota bacterium]
MIQFSKFAFLFCLCVALPAWGNPPATPTATPAPSPAAKARPFPFQSVLLSVDKGARTFRMGKKVIHQVHVLAETKLLKSDGTAAPFEALQPGVEIRGSVRKRSDADYDAVSVKIGPKPQKQ